MNRLPETVTTKFTVLFEALQDAADDLKIAGAEANLLGDFSQVNALNESCRRIQLLENEIQASLNNFTSKRNNNKTGLRKNRRYRTRKSGGRIRVMVMEKVIEEATIAETFLNALQVIGLEKVARLNKVISSAPPGGKNTGERLSGAKTV